MSAALESLMRAAPRTMPQRPRTDSALHYLAISVGGALSFVVLSSGLIWLETGAADWAVMFGCFAALIVPVCLLHCRYSFAPDDAGRQHLQRYLGALPTALPLAAMLSYWSCTVVALPTPVAAMLVAGLTAGVNLMMRRGWAFAQQHGRHVLTA